MVRTHFACSMDDGDLLLNIARSLAATCHDFTAYLFAHQQKSPTNNLLEQRISHTVLSESRRVTQSLANRSPMESTSTSPRSAHGFPDPPIGPAR